MSNLRFAVLGLGQFGTSLAQELCALGCEVLAIDHHSKRVEAVRNHVTVACTADVRDRDALEELITSSYSAAIISMGESLEATILATLHLREMGVKEIWAEASSPDRARVLKKVGATRILTPELDMGKRLAASLANPNLIEFLPLTEGFGVVELPAPSWLHGKTLAKLDLHNTMDIAVIAIRSVDGSSRIVPGGATRVAQEDVLTLVGRDQDLAAFQERE